MNEQELREVYIGGLFSAIAFVLPIAFHLLGLGAMFTPMLLPIFCLGFLVRFQVVLSAAIIVPLLSCFLTGMPPLYPPIVIVVMAEAAVLGVAASLLTKNLKINFWASLILSIIFGKITAIVITLVIANIFHLSKMVTGFALIIYTLPGILLQVIIIPLVYKLKKQRIR